MKIKNIYFGLEIEGIINLNTINEEEIFEYIENDFGEEEQILKRTLGNSEFWLLKYDGSLRESLSDFRNKMAVEFYTKKLIGFEELNKAINEFKLILSDYGKINLKEVIDFNKSCGCHIHFSFQIGEEDKTKELQFNKMISLDKLIKFRKNFFEEVKKTTQLTKDIKTQILKHYFRDYSKKTTTKNYLRKRDRYIEFNILSELSGKGFEWRSFNLLGVKKWEEFNLLFEMVKKCISNLIKEINKPEIKPIRIYRDKLIKDLISQEEIEIDNFKINLSLKNLKLNDEITI